MFCSSVISRNGVTYAVVEGNHTWLEAVGRCLLLGGNLAVIDSQTEFILMRSLLLQQRAGGATVKGLWVDGTDRETPGTWYCATRHSNCPYVAWSPKPFEGENHCACIWHAKAYDDGMVDCDCDNSDANFPLCEF